MRKHAGLGVAVLSLCLFAAAARAEDFAKETTPPDFKTYTAPDIQFTVQYPPDWRVQSQKDSVAFFAPPGDATGANLNIRWVKAPGVKVNDVVKPSLDQLRQAMTNFNLQTNEPAQFNSSDAHYLVYSAEVSSTPVKLGQLFIGAGPTIYIISFGSIPSGWNKTVPTAKQIIASFKPAIAQ